MGNAGNVTIYAPNGVSLNNNGQIYTTANETAIGNGGDVSITSRDISLANGSVINLSNTGQGNIGNALFSSSSLSLTDGSRLIATGQGKAGSVTINASDRISLDGMQSEQRSGIVTSNLINSTGNSVGIGITTGTLTLRNSAELNTNSNGMRDAGDVTINARDRVSFNNGRIFTSANDTATGKSGDISITSGDISLANGSLINLSHAGQGNAGNALFTTGSLSLTDRS